MGEITTIGLDLSKSSFQVHGSDAQGQAILRRKLRRSQVVAFFAGLPPCLVGVEAGSGAHYWARELEALGHDVRLIPPRYVKAYVKRNKTDAADAEAICEAVQRPSMHFAPIKSEAQQSVLLLHRSRELLIKTRTMLINAIRGHCAEFGIVAAAGGAGITELLRIIDNAHDDRLPALARWSLMPLTAQLQDSYARINRIEQKLQAMHRKSEPCQRLASVPGIGPLTATALIATIGKATAFRSGRQFSAWLGLTPSQYSTGGKDVLGRISKRGDAYLRRLLIHGARTVLRWQMKKPETMAPWVKDMLQRRPINVVIVAMASKTARAIWSMLTRDQQFDSTRLTSIA